MSHLNKSDAIVSKGKVLLPAFATFALVGLGITQPAHAQISGFTAANYTSNHGGDATHTGDVNDAGAAASIASNVLTITTAASSEANSVIYNTKQNITSFTASFTYTDTSGSATAGEFSTGNGATFFLENAPQGTAALGGRGDGLGYGNNDSGGRTPNYIANSAAIALNAYNPASRGTTGFFTAGAAGTGVSGYAATPGITLYNGNPIAVLLTYNGTTLTEKLTDTVTNNVYNASYTTNLVTVLGGNTAYVGFGGGTGGVSANQTISNFAFTPTGAAAPEPTAVAGLGLGLLGLIAPWVKMRKRSKA